MTSKLNRRTFLRGCGVTIALPFLDSMVSSARAAEQEAPARMAFVYLPNGVNIMKWTPTATGKVWKPSPTLAGLGSLTDHVSVLSGLGHPASKGGHSGADTWLTGADLEGTPGYDYRNAISIDQFAAATIGPKTRLPSLELSASGGTGSPGHSHTLAFNRNAVPIATENNPRLVFQRLFLDDSGDTRRKKALRFMEESSILDTVLQSASDLDNQLGKADRRKLDEYLTSVREVERRVKRAESWMDVPKAEVEAKGLMLDAGPNERGNRADWIRVMYDLMFLAFQTDTTRIATLQIGREAAGGYYSELGLNANHHELSHHGGDADMLEGLHKIDAFQIKQFAYFLTRLGEARDGDQSLLDRTMIMYGSGMNSGKGGGHSPRNLPLLFAGGSGLGIKQGQHHTFEDDRTPLSNLFVTMLNRMNTRCERFADSTGELSELT